MAGTNPFGLAIGDFNGDGIQDLVGTNWSSPDISIRIGDGAGNFSNTTNSITASNLSSVAICDLNSDGIQDVVCGQSLSGSLAIRYGIGNGTFSSTSIINVGTPYYSTVGDFNGDGRQDIVSPDYNGNQMSVLLATDNIFQLTSNGNNIVNGNSIFSTLNNTDFGNVYQGNYLLKSYSFKNLSPFINTINSIVVAGINAAEFSINGITFPATINSGTTISFNIQFAPNANGNQFGSIKINQNNCQLSSFNFDIRGSGVSPNLPVVGNYRDTTVYAGGNLSITPDTVPSNTSPVSVSSSPKFEGVITIDPISGLIKITDAKPSGNYLISLSSGTISLKSFQLHVLNPICSPGMFNPSVAYAGTLSPYGVAIGDFNVDGNQDIVGTGFIKLGTGNGNFGTTTSIYMGQNPLAVAIGDFNNDGYQDIVAGNNNTNAVYVRLGNGAGGFLDTLTFAAGSFSYSIAAADFNNDGKTDIATVNNAANTVTVLVGLQTGSFSTVATVSVGSGPISIVTGDFNNDGNLDFATANKSGSNVSIRFGNGIGGFSGVTNISVGVNPSSIAKADFNKDGNSDLVVANSGANTISVLSGNGSGIFVNAPVINSSAPPVSVTTGDFNGDGNIDIAATQNNNRIYFISGDGAGGFSGSIFSTIGFNVNALAVGDFNSDKREDIVSANSGSSGICISLGNDSGAVVKGLLNYIVDGRTNVDVFDNTDYNIVPTGNTLGHSFSFYNLGIAPLVISNISMTGLNPGEFSISGVTLPLTIAGGSYSSFNVALSPTASGIKTGVVHIEYAHCATKNYNFTVQGVGLVQMLGAYIDTSIVAGGNISLLPDAAPTGLTTLNVKVIGNFSGILSVNPTTGKIQITDAKPAGVYTVQLFATGFLIRSFTLTVTNPDCSTGYFENGFDLSMSSVRPITLGVCDLNNDNIQDLLSVSYQTNTITVQLGNGLGGFGVLHSFTAGSSPQAISVADFNGDGNQDIALANNTGTVSIRFGDGTGAFPGLLTSITVGSNPQSLVSGDFNNDGKMDLLVANNGSSTVSLLLGNGVGGFTVTSNISIPSPKSIITDDFNKDGKLDFACALNQSAGVSIWLGDDMGGFSNSSTVSIGTLPTSIASGDFNQDGNEDIVAVNSTAAYSLLGNGLGGFVNNSMLTLVTGSNYVAIGDFNGDSRNDLAITNFNTASFSIWLGNPAGNFTNTATFTCGAGPTGIVVVDFNADKKEDLAIANNTSSTISIRLGSGNSLTVSGNASVISNGSSSVSVLQNTDFGSVAVNSSLIKTYTIQNKGAAPVPINNINIFGLNSSDFSLPGISFPVIIPGGNSFSFNVMYSPAVVGLSDASVDINVATCATFDFIYAIKGTGYLYNAGVYPTISLTAGGNTTVVPSLSPGGATSLSAMASTGFTGLLFVDPTSGIVTITNAKPAGTYTVTVATNSGQTQAFSLIVNNPVCSQATFSGSNFTAATGAYKSVIGDFNNDGKQDVATTCSSSNLISIQLGDGNGGVSATTSVSAGTSPEFIVTGDFNNDGKLDLACTNFNSPNIIICLGNGIGGFTSIASLVLSGGCSGIATGDFNKDGNLDLAVSNLTTNTVFIRLGNGTGFFSGSTEINVGTYPRVITVSDFNNDGNQDFAVTNYSSGTVSVRLGNGLGGFSGTTNLTGSTSAYGLASADINNDGNQDLLFTNYGAANVFVELGNGTGNFIAQPAVSVGSSPSAICIADFNGDGFQDFVTANQNTFTSSLRFGNGTGAFTSNANTSIAVTFAVGTVLAGDFNNDGKFDLVTVNSGGTISILKNLDKGIQLSGKGINIPDGNLSYSTTNNTDFGITVAGLSRYLTYTIVNNAAAATVINNISFTGVNPSEFSIAGITFPLTIPPGGNIIFNIFFNPISIGLKNAIVNVNYNFCQSANYTFSVQGTGININYGNYSDVTLTLGENKSVIPIVVPQNSGGLFISTSSKFTGLLTIDPLTGRVNITNAKPAGVYTVAITSNTQIHAFTLTVLNPNCSPGTFSIPNSISNSASPYASAVGDFNNDGKQDLAIAVSSSIKINLGNGLGGFSVASSVTVGTQPNSIAVSDFNDDGIQDLAVSNFFSTNVSICKGNGTGGYTVTSSISTSSSSTCVIVGDFNNDTKNDLAIAVLYNNTVLIRLGDGAGGFTAAATISSGTPQNIAVGDFNNDGKQDLAITNYSSNTVSIKLGDGLGGFSGSTTITSTSGPYAIATGDFNSDGNVDLVCTNFASSNYSVFLGNGTGGFSTQTQFSAGSTPNSIVVGDFNGDSKQDLAISNQGSSTVSIRFGNGLGSFSGSTNITVGTNPYSIIAGDFNADKVLDLATANFNSNSVSILTGTNTGGLIVTGNGNTISNGSNVISPTNNTDFGSSVLNSPNTKNYVIQNASLSSSIINSINITGVSSSAFTVSGIILPVTIVAGGTTNFNLTFTPVLNTVYNATIHLSYNTCVVSDFSFLIQGKGIFDCSGNISDNNACTVDACNSITGISHVPINPNDGNPCTFDGCDSYSGIYHEPVLEICGNHVDDNCNGLIDENCSEVLNLTVFIEGFYIGNGTMRPTVDSVSFPMLCDTIVVELHSSVNPYSREFADTGTVDIYGAASFNFPFSTLSNSYYIVARHRSALETWSGAPIFFNDSVISFSFADSLPQAYGNNLFDLDDGNFALWSGDISNDSLNLYGYQDGFIQSKDYFYMEQAVFTTSLGYTPADLSGDGIVESLDYMFMENSYYFLLSSMHP